MDSPEHDSAGDPADRFGAVCEFVLPRLAERVGHDWSVRAGTLEWTCRHTLAHVIDCIFSFALQLGVRAEHGFLPFEELRPSPEAEIATLLCGLQGMGEVFRAVLSSVPADATASDGVMTLGVEDWACRGAYEVLIHTHDILVGFGGFLSPPADPCRWLIASPNLWMFDRLGVRTAAEPWIALLEGSGRKPTP